MSTQRTRGSLIAATVLVCIVASATFCGMWIAWFWAIWASGHLQDRLTNTGFLLMVVNFLTCPSAAFLISVVTDV